MQISTCLAADIAASVLYKHVALYHRGCTPGAEEEGPCSIVQEGAAAADAIRWLRCVIGCARNVN
jgi:hypothetical protein